MTTFRKTFVPGMLRKNYIVGVYRVVLRENKKLEDVAINIARSVSLSSDEDIFSEYIDKEEYEKRSAKISLAKVNEKTGIIEVGIPKDNIDTEIGGITQLVSILLGDVLRIKEVEKIRLDDVHLPSSFIQAYKGPAYGIEGINKTLDKEGPIISAIIQPNIGLSPSKYVENAKKAVEAGADMVCEDEVLVSPPYCHIKERVDKVAQELGSSGKSVFYFVNLTGRFDRVISLAEYLSAKDVSGVHFGIHTCSWLTDLSLIQILREKTPNLPIFAYPALHGLMIKDENYGARTQVLAELTRLAGADIMYIGNICGRFECGSELEIKMAAKTLTDTEWVEYRIKRTYPAICGGINPINVRENIDALGHEIVIHAASGIWGHPKKIEKGIEAMRQAVSSATNKIPPEEAVKIFDYKSLGEVLDIEKWKKKDPP